MIVAALVCVAGGCRGGDPESTNVEALAAEGVPARSPSYASAEDAAWALVAWLRNDDPARAASALGPVAERALERSGLDATARAAAGQASRDRWLLDYVGDGCVFLDLGMSARRFPVPVVRCGSRWCVRGHEAEPSCASTDG